MYRQTLQKCFLKGENMEVRLAESAGFCFGDKKAMEKVYEQIENAEGKKMTIAS